MAYCLPGLLLFLFTAGLNAQAQSTQQAIEARLKGHPLYLRGQWVSNRLQFDLAGVTSSPAISAPFTLCGMDVKQVKLTPNRLQIVGDRIGLEFDGNSPQRVSLDTKIQIEIAGSSAADYGPALDKIFADDLPALVPSLPFYWQEYAEAHLLPQASTHAATPPRQPLPAHLPQLLQSEEPEITTAARLLRYRGSSLVHIIIKEDGTVHEPYIVRPAGLGLDEQALYAVAHYRFKPATDSGGKAIATPLDIEINFDIRN